MATVKYSVSAYIADGTTTDYLITWDYLDDDHITVEVDGVSNSDPAANHTFVKLNDTTVRVTDGIGGAIAAGKEIQIRRRTPITTRPINFADGSALLAEDLNKNSDYLLYSMQEALDQVDFTVQYQKEAESFRDETQDLRDETQTFLTTVQSDATDADNHRIAAALSETNAAASEAAAAVSETNAANSATTAQTAETGALASAAAALVSQNAAEASEIAAATSETNAAASAAAAAGSEAGVAADAATATAKAAAAATSETNAAVSATNSANAANASQASATASANSASASATSAVNAANSEASASNSESNAQTYATNAQTSATNAATSELNAGTSETAAATSATNAAISEANAATSASDALASKTAAETALDAFDDRYLGAKASDPSVDNDGDPLTQGSLYFNTTDNVMKVYEGTVWVAAYASLSGALLSANNLSDVLSIDAARQNIGLEIGVDVQAYNANLAAIDQSLSSTSAPSFVSASFTGTSAIKLPSGTTAQQPTTPSLGMFRYNATEDAFEGYTSEGWGEIGGAAELIDCGTASSQSGTLFDLGSASSA